MTTYKICGRDRNDKRFTIHTETPQHYNIWQGNIYKLTNGKYKKVHTVTN